MFFSEKIIVIRSAGGEYVNGIYTESPEKTIMTAASVQPLSGKELLILPEGKRDKESLKVLCDFELFQVDEAKGKKPDIIEWLGKKYEVHSVKRYTQVLPHFEAVVVNLNKLREAD